MKDGALVSVCCVVLFALGVMGGYVAFSASEHTDLSRSYSEGFEAGMVQGMEVASEQWRCPHPIVRLSQAVENTCIEVYVEDNRAKLPGELEYRVKEW